MRPSKSRSRSKSNRSRSVGNIVNRVFESSGPEGKVRGTPQQIIEKYNQLARDAQLSNDRVATENFQQHAEHYTRMLAEAQREQEARREQQERERHDRQQRDHDHQRGGDQSAEPQHAGRAQDETPQPSESTTDVFDMGSHAGDSGLVETPESAPKPKPRNRRPRRSDAQGDGPAAPGDGQAEAAE